LAWWSPYHCQVNNNGTHLFLLHFTLVVHKIHVTRKYILWILRLCPKLWDHRNLPIFTPKKNLDHVFLNQKIKKNKFLIYKLKKILWGFEFIFGTEPYNVFMFCSCMQFTILAKFYEEKTLFKRVRNARTYLRYMWFWRVFGLIQPEIWKNWTRATFCKTGRELYLFRSKPSEDYWLYRYFGSHDRGSVFRDLLRFLRSRNQLEKLSRKPSLENVGKIQIRRLNDWNIWTPFF